MADKWQSPEYSTALLNRLKLLYDKGHLCDFTLAFGDVKVKVHIAVLYSASRYVKNTLRELNYERVMREPSLCLPSITGCDLPHLENLVQFMYSGSLILTETNISMTLTLASLLDIPEAAALCHRYMTATPNKLEPLEDDVLDLFVESETYSRPHDVSNSDRELAAGKDVYVSTSGRMSSQTVNQLDSTMLQVDMKIENPVNEDDDILQSILDDYAGDITKHDEPIPLATCTAKRRGRPRKRPLEKKVGPKTSRITRSKSATQTKPDLEVLGELEGPMVAVDKLITASDEDIDDVEFEPFLDDELDQNLDSSNRNQEEQANVSPKTTNKKGPRQKRKKGEDEDFVPEISSAAEDDDDDKDFCDPKQKHRSSSRSSTKKRIRKIKRPGEPRKLTVIDKMQEEAFMMTSLLRAKQDEGDMDTGKPVDVLNKIYSTEKAGGESKNEVQNSMEGVNSSQATEGTSSDDLVCGVCNELFSTAIQLRIHARTHTGEKPYTCLSCDKSFNGYRSLKRHLMIHLKRRPHECNICHKSYVVRNHLKNHMMIHSGDKPHKCTLCDKSFVVPSGLKKHMLSHSGERNCACPMCPRAFATPYSLKSHMFTHTNERPHPCTQCEVKCKTPKMLRKHMETHNSTPHYCPVCGRKLKSNKILQRHLLTHNDNRPRSEATHICEICGAKFTQFGSLSSHMKIHYGVKDFACTYCDMRFVKSHNLKRHLMTHTGEKPHKCQICERSFGHSHNLESHMRTHTGEKPHTCVECGRQFSFKKSMLRHMYRHNGIRPYSCEICGKGFIQPISLKTHKCLPLPS